MLSDAFAYLDRTLAGVPHRCDVEHMFSEVRVEHHNPPARLEYNGDHSDYYTAENVVYVNEEKLWSHGFAKSILRHEVGHLTVMPITQRRYRQMQMACTCVSDDANLRHMAANLLSDFILDEFNQDIHGDDLVAREHLVLEHDYQQGPDPFCKLRIGVYNQIVGVDIIPDDIVPRESHSIRSIMQSRKPIETQTREVCQILKDYLKKNNMQPKDAPQKMLEDLMEALESGESEDQKGKVLKEVQEEDYDNWEKYSEACRISGIDATMHDYYLSRAKNKIRFTSLAPQQTGGYVKYMGVKEWDLEDAADVDVQASLEESPFLLPENMLMSHYQEGRRTVEAKPAQLLFILDVSGSMEQETAMITLYSLLESARQRGIPAGVVTFSVGVTYSSKKIRTDYDRMERECLDGFVPNNTLLAPALGEASRILSRERKTQVIIASDLYLNDQEESERRIAPLRERHSLSLIVVCRQEKDPITGVFAQLPAAWIKDQEELASAVIGEVNGL